MGSSRISLRVSSTRLISVSARTNKNDHIFFGYYILISSCNRLYLEIICSKRLILFRSIKFIVCCIMLSKKKEGDRFAKVLTTLQTEKIEKWEPPKLPKLPSAQTSFLQDYSIRSDKSTKYGSQPEARSTTQMDESRALKYLMGQPEVLINKQVVKVKTEIVPTSNGMRFIILVGTTMINLSWLHSVK